MTRLLLAPTLVATLALGWVFARSPIGFDDALARVPFAPSVQLAARAVELAAANLQIASTPIRGELGSGYQWTRGERVQGGVTTDLAADGFDPITLTLAFPTVGVGASVDAIARARGDLARAQADHQAAQRSLRVDVTRAFQDNLRAQQALAITRLEVAYTRLEVEALRYRVSVGAANAQELARAELTLARTEQSERAGEAEVDASARLLGLLIGHDVMAAESVLPAPSLPEALADAANPEGGVAAGRLDVLTARLNLAEAERQIASTLRENLPSLSLRYTRTQLTDAATWTLAAGIDTRTLQPSVSASFDPDSGLPISGARSDSQTIAVSVRVPLNPSLPIAIEAANLTRERAAQNLALTSARAALDIAQRAGELRQALAQADLLRSSAALVAAESALIEARVTQGTLPPLAFERARIDALRANLDAERALDNARIAQLRYLDALATCTGDPCPQPANLP